MKKHRILWLVFAYCTAGLLSDARAYRVAPSNLALNKSATQSSTSSWSTTNDAQGAVDGVKNGRWGFHTGAERNPWWQVDLQSSATLTEIRVFNRLDCCAERARSLRILLSDDGLNWRTMYRHDGTAFGGNDGQPLIVSLNAEKARFVRLQLDASEYFHLDEVEVFGYEGGAGAPATDGREIHSDGTTGNWNVGADGVTTGNIPNDCGFSYHLLSQTMDRSSLIISARLRFRSHVDYGGAGLALLDPSSTNERMPQLRLELSERQDHFGAGGWLDRKNDYYKTPDWKNAGRDIRVGEWYRLRLQVDGNRVRGFLDDVELFAGEIPAVSSLPKRLQLALFIIESDVEFDDVQIIRGGISAGSPAGTQSEIPVHSTHLRLSKSVFSPEEEISIAYAAMPGHAQDWITIARAGDPPTSYGEWFYTAGMRSGTKNFRGLGEGSYEIRVYYDWPNGQYDMRDKIAFTVGAVAIGAPATTTVIEDDISGITWYDGTPEARRDIVSSGSVAFRSTGNNHFLQNYGRAGDGEGEFRYIEFDLFLIDSDADIQLQIQNNGSWGNRWGFDAEPTYNGYDWSMAGTTGSLPYGRWMRFRKDLIKEMGMSAGNAITGLAFSSDNGDANFDRIILLPASAASVQTGTWRTATKP